MTRPADLLELGTALAGFDRTPSDSCVAHDTGREMRRVLATINATTGDLLLARELGCDAVLLHHPLAGAARRDFHRVLERMIELLVAEGVDPETARAATKDLRRRCRFNDHASDWDHLVSAARLLDLSLLNVHLAADELGRQVFVEALAGLEPGATLEDAAEALRDAVPELAHPSNEIIHVPEGPAGACGRIAVMHAGGTNGGSAVAECLFEGTGRDGREPVRTVLYIHLAGADAGVLQARAASGRPGSVLVTGHLASDAVGMRILMDEAAERLGVEFIAHGGLGTFRSWRGPVAGRKRERLESLQSGDAEHFRAEGPSRGDIRGAAGDCRAHHRGSS